MKSETFSKFIRGVILLALLLSISNLVVLAQENPASNASQDNKYEISLQSRRFVPEPGISREVRDALEKSASQELDAGRDKLHTIIQLDNIPTTAQRIELRQQGVELLTYIPNYAWLASIPATNSAEVASLPGVRWVGHFDVSDKLQPELAAQEFSPGNYDPESSQAALLVQFYKDIRLPQGAEIVQAHGGQVVDLVDSLNMLLVYMPESEIEALAAEDGVEWIEQPIAPLEALNDGNRARVGADTLQNLPYSLDGTNVDVLVYDGGRVYSHSDLDSKRTWGDSAGSSEHATHVACTILGTGAVNSTYRGMAPNAELLSMGFEYNNTGVFLYTNPGDIQNDLSYAKNSWGPSADLYNASIGTNTAWNGFPCVFEGNYGATSQLFDQIVRGSLGEPFIAAAANGNERGGACGSTYHTTAPPACAKNPIHSGATDSVDDSMTSFSSWGPCDDGRIKPTISSPGYNVMSCNDSNSYENMSGTSMASPTTAGIIALMLEQYRTTYSTSGEFLPSTAKALLIHTAVDLGNTGPDYQFGYGRIDGVEAVDAIIAGDFREETITAHNQVDEYTITVSGSPSQFRASLAWDDPAGSLAAYKKLVNNLDLEVQAPNGAIYYPWVLDPSSPSSPATTGSDDINNQEQVVVNSPANGTWIIRVKGTLVPDAPQKYSIVFSGAGAASKSTTAGSPPAPNTTCDEVLNNGNFDSGTTPWIWSGSATRSSTYAYSGSYSGRVGGTSDGYFYQELTLPTNFYTGTLSYRVRMETDETSHIYDYFYAEIVDESNNTLTTMQVLGDNNSSYEGTWHLETFTLDAGYAGQTVRVYFAADVDSTVNTYGYVDNVSLVACNQAINNVYIPLVLKNYGSTSPAPGAFNKSAPANGATGQSASPTLSWGTSSDATSYEYCIDTNNNNACDATWTSTGTNTSIGLSGLSNSTTYYWQVRANNSTDTTYANGSETSHWSFTTASGGWSNIMTETFEGSFPGNWDVFEGDGTGTGEYIWGKRNCQAYEGSNSGWAVGGGADGSGLSCGSNYPDDTFSWMVYGPFSLVSALDAELNFMYWVNAESGYDAFFVGASIDGSDFYGDSFDGDSGGWEAHSFDLTNVYSLGDLTGETQVWIAFVFYGDYMINYPNGAFIDNIVLRQCESNCSSSAPDSLTSRTLPVYKEMHLER